MSVLVVVRKNGRAVIGADTAESSGDLLLSAEYVVNSSKLLSCEGGWLGLAGWSATQAIIESVLRRPDHGLDFSNRGAIFESARKLHTLMKSDYFMDPQEDKEQPVESSQISALICNANGIYELESYRSVAEYQRFWAIGSGRNLAIGAMHAMWPLSGDPVAIAEAGLRAACQFDDGCALPIELQAIDLAAGDGILV